MAVRRKRFRIEDIQGIQTSSQDGVEGTLPLHHEIMTELAALRREMAFGRATPTQDEAPAAAQASVANADLAAELSATTSLLESYRAQIAQCDKLKVELDLIHDAISRTKQEIAVLHGKSFNGSEMAEVTGELGAVVGGTEQATQRILEAAEAIDHAAGSITSIASPEQQARLSADIQEQVISIFEACNFQDLTGQRIAKVMATVKFVEHHINVMMDIWGGIDAIKAHAQPVLDTRSGDERLLNGPKGADNDGHASQDEIDAMFG